MDEIRKTAIRNKAKADRARFNSLLRTWASELAEHTAEVWFPGAAPPPQQVENFKKVLFDAFKRVEDRTIHGIRPGDER
jgi:hypothetical protein